MKTLEITLYAIYVASLIYSLANYTDKVDRSGMARSIGKSDYMGIAFFVSLMPVLNTIVAFGFILDKYNSEVNKRKKLQEELDFFVRRRYADLQKYMKEAERRSFEMDPELWCRDHGNMRYIYKKSFEEYWSELHQVPMTND